MANEENQDPVIDPYSWAITIRDWLVPRAVQTIVNRYARLAHSAEILLVQAESIEGLAETIGRYQTFADLRDGLLHSHNESDLIAAYFCMSELCEDLQGSELKIPTDELRLVRFAVQRQRERFADEP